MEAVVDVGAHHGGKEVGNLEAGDPGDKGLQLFATTVEGPWN
jgi:hypothetical protein